MARTKKVIDLDTYNALDAYCIALHVYYTSLRKAGFSMDMAYWLLLDQESYPSWILPSKPIEKIGSTDYEDDDED
jgi:hypothetical protein